MSSLAIRRASIVLALAGAALLPACSLSAGPDDDRPTKIEGLPRALSAGERELIARSNTFAFELLREVYRREAGPNVFLSPLSATMALGMTLNGAAHLTFDSMRVALGLEGLSQDAINRSYQSLVKLLLGLDPKVELAIANSTWANRHVPIVPAFTDAVRTWFDADARTVDFADPATLGAINRWAADHTNQRIPRVLDALEPDMVMILMNAVYFRGDWTNRFDAARTSAGPFRLSGGETVPVAQMRGELPAAIRWQPDVVVGELPYGGQAFVMTIVLPNGDQSITDVVARLDDATWREWTRHLDSVDYDKVERTQVVLPKLELEYEKRLNEALAAMGMGVAFDSDRADFSRLTPARSYIDYVKQNTFLKIDEKGTEAAAVTTVGVRVVSAPPQLIVDRPYLLAIRERLSGTILFLGVIGDPR